MFLPLYSHATNVNGASVDLLLCTESFRVICVQGVGKTSEMPISARFKMKLIHCLKYVASPESQY